MKKHRLVGCMDKLDDIIRTRFFFLNTDTEEVTDVTLQLCLAIDKFNEVAKAKRDTGEYAMIIPYEYTYGLAEYSFGCGLTHYLQESEFEKIEEAVRNSGNKMAFPLADCSLRVLTPKDVKSMLSCNNVFDAKIYESLHKSYGLAYKS